MTHPPVLALSGLRAIAPQYDVFLVDLWGVVHDGKRPFAGVIDALRELSREGRRVIFVTNSSRDGVRVAAMLEAMGIDRELFEAVISSGDVTRPVPVVTLVASAARSSASPVLDE